VRQRSVLAAIVAALVCASAFGQDVSLPNQSGSLKFAAIAFS